MLVRYVIKAVSYWERKKMKEVIDEALGDYLKGEKIRFISNEGDLSSYLKRKRVGKKG